MKAEQTQKMVSGQTGRENLDHDSVHKPMRVISNQGAFNLEAPCSHWP